MTIDMTKQIQSNYTYLAKIAADVARKKEEEKAAQTTKQA